VKLGMLFGGPPGVNDVRQRRAPPLPPPIAEFLPVPVKDAIDLHELAFHEDAIKRLRNRRPDDAIAVLDGLERFFDEGRFWIRKNNGQHGNCCLVGGVFEASRICGVNNGYDAAFHYLGQAIDPNGGSGSSQTLAEWNARCETFPILRKVIDKARALARADQERLAGLEAALPARARRSRRQHP
jgi:hypothetical protein